MSVDYKTLESERHFIRAMAVIVSLSLFWIGIIILRGTEHEGTICLIRNLTGWPCAGCGMTRGAIATLKGDFVTAFYLNPLSLLIPPFLLFMGVGLLFFPHRLYLAWRQLEFFFTKKRHLIWVFLLVLINWLFILKHNL